MNAGAPAVVPAQAHVQVVQVHMVNAIGLQLVVMPGKGQTGHTVPALKDRA